LRVAGSLLSLWTALAIAAVLAAQPQLRAEAVPQDSAVSASPFSAYQGLKVAEIRFPDLPDGAQQQFQNLIDQRPGEPLDRHRISQSIKTLYETGRFGDIRVEAERTRDGEVALAFVTTPNYFVGDIRVEGTPNRPNPNQVVNASKLQLGELFTAEKLARAEENIKRLMAENGFYKSAVMVQQQKHPKTQLIDLTFQITPGPQAHVGRIIVTGDPHYSQGQIQDIAKMHPGDKVSVQLLSRALDRLRKKYQKAARLLAQVAIAGRQYSSAANSVDYTFNVQPGPTVEILVEGFKISRGVLKKNVPVYEENALDDDLLNEGRRNLLNYMQTRGYFDAKIGIKKRDSRNDDELKVVYVIDPGPRHKLVTVELVGNKYFPEDLIRSRMQVQPAGKVLAAGRYNQGLLNEDVAGITELYRQNGFQNVRVTPTVIDNYQNQTNQLAVRITIDEGPQTLVGALHIVGNQAVPESQYPPLNILPGQPYSESSIASDRDILLTYYFNHGFPSATFEASAKPAPEPNLMEVTYTVHEGQQIFVDNVLLSGLEHTHKFIVDRELQIKPGDPLSQLGMLRTQQSLYNLGIFSQVDTAVENPNGSEPRKNVLVDVQEAKRYTFNYGIGLEFQTGTPNVGTNQPLGETGVSPRVSFEVSRLNFRGRDHTVTFKTHVGRLQQRALFSYDAPRWFNSDNWRLSFTTFYDNTLDVTTFTSERLEGSVSAAQTISRASTMFYRFTYRRVRASNIAISADQIPLLSQPVRVGIPGFSYIRDKRDNPLESTKGNYTTFDGGVAASYFGSEADFSRLLVQNATYQPFGKNRPAGKKFVFARSTRIGIENPYGRTVVVAPGEPVSPGHNLIPLPERFFSGGGNSHRGFGLNQAGPRDPTTGFPLGGAALFLNNLELRLPPVNLPVFQDNISFAVFHDAGNVFTNGHDMLHNLLRWKQKDPKLCEQASTAALCNYNYVSQAVGVGVRYKTPIGPVRFDFGYNLNPPKFPSFQTIIDPTTGQSTSTFVPQQANHFNLFFSIGQTF